MSNPMKIGVIGCGNIFGQYAKGLRMFPHLELCAVADINQEAASAKGEEHDVEAVSVEALLADERIDIVVNLTVPKTHTEVNMRILEGNKHVYCEKPFALEINEAKEVMALAAEKGLRVGSAPDTFMGAGHQTSRKAIDDGWIGTPVAGTAFFMGMGPEAWHPNPAFFYQYGGGPMFDVGVYPITALVNLLGPIKSISAITTAARKERLATCKEHFGEMLKVEVPTHYSGSLLFENGTVITMGVSFDVPRHKHTNIEIYGTEGTLQAPDPNGFDGVANLYRIGGEWKELPHSHVKGYCRGLGVADMAQAIIDDRPHRASAEQALHVLEAMHAFEKSSTTGEAVTIENSCPQPAAFPLGLVSGMLD
jgi:predicted dehydrogenase